MLIDQNNVVKVGDFGMARDISVDGIYTKTSDVSTDRSKCWFNFLLGYLKELSKLQGGAFILF